MPSTVYLVTGGCRSGKSSYAQSLCESICKEPIYLATSKAFDDDFQKRIEKHQQCRGEHWTTIEEPLIPSAHDNAYAGKAIMVDCLTLWLTNYMMEEGAFTVNANTQEAHSNDNKSNVAVSGAADRALNAIKKEFDKLTKQWNATFIFVTNEIGSGTHAENELGRKFVDAQGWFNQYVAKRASKVIHMVCGIPNVIKDENSNNNNNNNNNNIFPSVVPQNKVNEAQMLDEVLSTRGLVMDSKGYVLIKVDREKLVIRILFYSCIVNDKNEVCDLDGNKLSCCDGSSNNVEPMAIFEGRTAKEVTVAMLEQWEHATKLITIGHAAYIAREVQKAEYCLYSGQKYIQD